MATTQSRSQSDARWRPRCPTLVSYHFEEELPDENRIIISVDLLRELTSIAPGIFGKPTSLGSRKPPASNKSGRGQAAGRESRNLQPERLAVTPESGSGLIAEGRSRRVPDPRSRIKSELEKRFVEEAKARQHVTADVRKINTPQEIRKDNELNNKDDGVIFEEDIIGDDKDEQVPGTDSGQERKVVKKSGHSKPLLRRPILTNGHKVYRTASSQSMEKRTKTNPHKQHRRTPDLAEDKGHDRKRAKKTTPSILKKQVRRPSYAITQPSPYSDYIGIIGAEVRRLPVSRPLSLPKVAGSTCVLHEKDPVYEAWQSPLSRLTPRSKTSFGRIQYPDDGRLEPSERQRAPSKQRNHDPDDASSNHRNPAGGTRLLEHGVSGMAESGGRTRNDDVGRPMSAFVRVKRKSSTPGLDVDCSLTRNTDPTPRLPGCVGQLPASSTSPTQYVITWLNET